RVVLLRGEGRSFAAGGDFMFLDDRVVDDSEHNRRVMVDYYESFLSVRKIHAPTIAVLHGAAIGAGLCLALACDLRLAAPEAKLGVNFVRLGLHPGMGATWLLPRLVGPAKAKELILTGRIITAQEGLPMGLVNALYPRDDLLSEAMKLADEIAANAPLAVARACATLDGAAERSLWEALRMEANAQALDYATDDMREGLAAAKARRPPRFTGR
ncbi:MAG: enoyl-CoA hydratase/isomerase family protein, partial [Deltaproteobacteria bacterium]|nr:enoyl-CoA hydratase/isomerase family protein [Deltaproteobacteria bacterium]